MTQRVDLSHPQLLSLFGRGEKNADRENLKIGISQFSSASCIIRIDLLLSSTKFNFPFPTSARSLISARSRQEIL
ncbi:hypothetical protein [Hydrococcus rivularis]|uniref:hypothetical protein n=1 Tax=Hydrococcus rivularis TaxID=1616834 RepID=UPI000AB163B3|nr:hypothetical protein [Hydrococcus rivularis]